MNTINLSAEIFRELSYIADDENYLKKALSSIKQLVSQKEKAQQAKEIAEADEEYRPLSKAEILDNIEKDLPSQPKKLAPRYFERYGKDLFYATFRVNKHTHWYVFFNVYQKENGTIFLVKYISNNHVIAQYL